MAGNFLDIRQIRHNGCVSQPPVVFLAFDQGSRDEALTIMSNRVNGQ